MANSTGLKASSATEGFFQTLPKLQPAYTFDPQSTRVHAASDDVALARVLELYLPTSSAEANRSIHNLSRRALHPSTLRHSIDAEVNQPILRSLTTFGEENRVDPLVVSQGWKALTAIGQEEGLVSSAYDPETEKSWNRRIHQFALNHVWTSSAAMTGCPASMTDGAARLLQSHMNDPDGDQPGRVKVIQEAYRRLVSKDPTVAWTSGQWMTERTGGSDVRGTETVARRMTDSEISQDAGTDAHGMQLGPWRIDGFKWFSSATDSNMAILLAQTKSGLSLFYIPMRRSAKSPDAVAVGETELNGIRISRLKNKMGTKQLPTAELELKGVRGWLIGQEGRGVKEISTILNITRLYTAGGSAAGWGRGLSICRAYTRVRKVQGRLLEENRLHIRWMAEETVKYHAAMQFTYLGLALQGAIEQDWDQVVQGTKASKLIPRDKKQASTLLRLITPAMKALVSVASCEGLRSCMEGLGGVGYCENNEHGGLMNVARILRDTQVNPIWEGTVSVMAEDLVRVLVDKRIGDGRVVEVVLAPWIHNVLESCRSKFPEECVVVEDRLNTLINTTKNLSKEELLYGARESLRHLETVVSSALLMFDACTDGNEVAVAIAQRYIRSKTSTVSTRSWEEESAMDRKIFLGLDAPAVIPVKL